jgi:hypothetical protein
MREQYEVPLIGYGSLMSGMGLLQSGRLRVRMAERVALLNCRRGFAKYAQRGDRFALDIEFADRKKPISALLRPRGSEPEGVEGILLWVRAGEIEGIMEREGYSPAVFHKIVARAREKEVTVGKLFWEIYVEAGWDLILYRRRLFDAVGYTSPHYIPHPVPLGGESYGILFLAPSYQATGSDQVISVRQRTGVAALMSLAEAWERKSNAGQVNYMVSCLLGGLHGINVRDLIGGVEKNPSLLALLRERILAHRQEEIPRFLRATNLHLNAYIESFGALTENLHRGGLFDLLGECPDWVE